MKVDNDPLMDFVLDILNNSFIRSQSQKKYYETLKNILENKVGSRTIIHSAEHKLFLKFEKLEKSPDERTLRSGELFAVIKYSKFDSECFQESFGATSGLRACLCWKVFQRMKSFLWVRGGLGGGGIEGQLGTVEGAKEIMITW